MDELATQKSGGLLLDAEARLERMRVFEALALFDEAERAGCDPDACAAGRWTGHMLAGDFEKAWQQSDAIGRRGKPDANRFWDGRPLRGKRVLIRCLHGLGDTLQFIRYARLLQDVARQVSIEAQPSLCSLLAASELADCVITWGKREPEWDSQIEVVELPRIFRTRVETVPGQVPYLKTVGKAAVGAAGDLLRVGVVWSSSAYNPARSVPAPLMAELFDAAGCAFYSLQAGPERLALAPWKGRAPSVYREGQSVMDTARIVEALDLVITVDTMMAHLAGGLGVAVWTLLPYACDWRWMLDRGDSPWYPTMRLFRQPAPGDWPSVLGTVKQNLVQLARRRVQSEANV